MHWENEAPKNVLLQLFLNGPTWDGNIVSKSGRDYLHEIGFIWRTLGWQGLTAVGLQQVLLMDLTQHADNRYLKKQGMN